MTDRYDRYRPAGASVPAPTWRDLGFLIVLGLFLVTLWFPFFDLLCRMAYPAYGEYRDAQIAAEWRHR